MMDAHLDPWEGGCKPGEEVDTCPRLHASAPLQVDSSPSLGLAPACASLSLFFHLSVQGTRSVPQLQP